MSVCLFGYFAGGTPNFGFYSGGIGGALTDSLTITALAQGFPAALLDRFSPLELVEFIREAKRADAARQYGTALLTGLAVNRPDAFPKSVYEAFPDLFPEAFRAERIRQAKAEMREIAQNINRRKRSSTP